MQITTDKKWKPFKNAYDVPTRILKQEFDWLNVDEATDGFFRYRNVWYHIDQFMRAADASTQHVKRSDMQTLEQWDAYSADSAFSGIVLRVSKDGERYMVGTYIS